ncbi:hypothetical protein [Sphingomonas mali]|uniref:hypothetical protein n=1 Tax=Sphingomonas mali TaxID=40682 RepID=UPI00082CA948|nr:hypothetical protein [Sphingomonas mali]
MSSSIAARRRNLRSQASRLTLRSTVAAAAFVGLGVFAPSEAWAQCVVGAVTVTCADTSTTDTTFPTNPPVDRNYQGILPTPIVVTVNSGATISGNGLAFTNNGTGGITVNNGGTISVDAGNTPTAGGTAALSLTALGGPIVYTGGDIVNNGNGNALDARQSGGIGSVSITAGNIFAATGEGITVRDVATSTGIDITTNGTVTALTAGKDGIDAQSQSLTGNITEVANGNIQAGNAGMVAAILNAGGTGNIDVTANGSIDARFGVDAENFGSGSTGVTTVGPVNVTTGNGIFALSTGGDVTVNTGDVTATSNTAIIAQQTKVAGTGQVVVGTTGNVSGTTGIDAHNFGTGLVGVVTGGTVTGAAAEGIKAVGNAGVTVTAFDTVTGATRGLSLIGGTGGAGDILVNGPGGFVGGTGDAANILNNGSGTVTVDIGGASSSAGGEGFVVRDTATGGNISVTTGAVTALTAGKDAIDVQSQSATANITEVANGDINAGNAGMVAAILNAGGTGNIDVTANGAMTARFGVDAENFGSGSTSVTTVGPVNVTTGNGIFALTTGGTVTVNAGDVTSTGNTAIIAQQTKVAGAGNVDVTAGNVSGTTGIDAHNFGTGTTSVTTNGTVTGTAAEGIKATGNDAVTINVADTVTGATRGLSLVGGTGGAGNISVTGTGGFLGGTGDAANILNNGSGTVTVDISGASGSTGGEGIVVRDTAIGGDISVTTGAVTALTAGKDAIDVQSQSATANVTEVANGDINAGNAGMVAAILNAGGTGNIDVTANGAMTARFGVDAENFGSGSTSVTTVGPVNVTTGNGIFALTTGGTVTVNAGDVTSTGNTAIIAQQTKVAGVGNVGMTAGNVSGTTGIDAHNFGTGTVSVTANGTVTGTAAEGIKATGNDAVTISVADTVTGATNGLSLVGGTGGAGNISVTGTGGFLGGTGDGANIKNNGSGTVTFNISGASGSTGGNGIIVRDTAAGGDISVTTGAVTALTAGKNAIDAQSQSLTANITEVANGDINAGNAGMVAAIFPAAATGNIDVTANGAMTARFGVDAENFGTGTTSVTTVGPVNVTTGNGIFALTTGGTVTVNAGDVTSTGNTAIIAQQTKVAGAGNVDVTAGNVSGTTGIDAHNFGTGTVSVTANGTVTGTAAEGIKATGNNAVTISVADTVTGATRGLSLVGGTGGTGNISVTGAGGFFGGTGDAANIQNNGSGTVTFNISGASGSTGGNGIVVRDTAAGGDISVTTGAVTALTAGQNAIDVLSQSLTANITEVANGDINAGNAGMVAAIFPSAATGNIDVTANGAMTARFGVDAENFGTGTTSVTTVGPVNVTTGNGIFALTAGGNVTVNAGDVTSTGNTAIIAQQTKVAGAGNVDVTAGNVSGTTGIDAHNFGTGTVSVAANGTVTGTTAEGIKATGNGAVTISVADTVTGATNGLSLVGGTGGAGNISVTGTGGFFGGTGDGANIQNNGSGTVTFNISGASGSTGGNGIIVRDTVAGGDISVTTGAVTALTAGMDGIEVLSQSNAANVTIVANGDVNAGNAGIVGAIFPGAATGNVDVTANGAINARFGVDAENFGSGTTSVTTVGPVNVTTGNGVYASSRGGNVTINSGDVTSTGDVAIIAQQLNASGAGNVDVTGGNVSGTTGIVATNVGTGTVGVTANGTVTGTSAEGILATGNGAVTVTAANTVTGATRGLSLTGGSGGAGNILVTGTGFFGGTGDAVNVVNNGSGTTTVNISGASGSTGGYGIDVVDTVAGGDINVTTGAVTAQLAAINVQAQTLAGNLTIVANGDLNSNTEDGINAFLFAPAGTGNIDATANGAVTGLGGIFASTQGSGLVTVNAVGPINSTIGNGVYGYSRGGDINVATNAVTTTGNVAIFVDQANAAGAGNVTVTTGGAISGTSGIQAFNFGTGTIDVTTNGTVTGTSGEGILATGNGAVTVTAADTVTGATRGVSLVGGSGGTGNILITGTGFFGGSGDAANVQNNGAGTVTVNISGASGSTAGNGIIVRDTALGGDISVTTGAVSALAAGMNGIDVRTQSLTANVTEIANGDINAGNAGMVAAIFPVAATGNIDVTANGAINAAFSVDAENFGAGNTNVTTVGTVNATAGTGIYAQTNGGNVSVNAGDVFAIGGFGIRAQQISLGAGSIDVTAGNVSGARGIYAVNSGIGTVSVTTSGTVTGIAAEGIYARGGDAVTISAANTVTGATNGLLLIGGSGGAGNISVTGTGFFGGSGDAANIQNNGAGTVTVNISGASGSTSGNGIFVRDTAAGGDINVTTGAVTALAAGMNGIDARSLSNAANVTIVANGDINAGNAGIVGAVLNAGGTGNVDVTANGAINGRFGVDAENFGTGTTSVTTVGPVNVTTGNGIFALTAGGNVTVNSGDVTSTGNTAIIAQQTNAAGAGNVDVTAGNVSGTTGIVAINSGTGMVGVTANGTVTGTAAEGILATGGGAVTVNVADAVTGATNGLTLVGGTGGAGNILVTGTGAFFGGSGDAANIQNNGSGTVTFDISAANSSTGGNGIVVRDTAAGGDINITTGAVTALAAGMNGIDARSLSNTANLAIVANGDVAAGNAAIVGAILNGAGTGNVDVTGNGAINARFGVDAENFGTGNTSVTTVGPVNVTTGNGIYALATGGNVTINAGDVTSTGNTAILAQQTNAAGTGSVDVTADTVSGTTGIVAVNLGTGTTSVTTTGLVTGTAAEGINAIGGGAVTVNVADTVTGATNGLKVIGGTGGAGNILVTGTGSINGLAGNGATIQNNGSGTVTVDISAPVTATGGAGVLVRDTVAGGDINVTTGAVTSTDQNGIDVIGSSTTGNIAVVTNGQINGGNAGVVAALVGAGTGNVDVTTNAAVNGVFGIDAENYGTGNVNVTAVGLVTATTGYGIVGLTGGGNVVVNAGNVSSIGAAAILAEQINSGASGTVGVTVGNVSGRTGIIAQTNGSGGISVNALGNVTATNGNGIEAVNFNPAANAGTIDVSQAADTKITATNGSGIYTDSGLSTGMTTITVAGEITAGTPGYAGVYGTSTKGGITVNVTGTGVIDPDYGIDLSTVDGPLVVNNAGLVTGTIDGVRLVATGTGSANISNSGTISGGTNAVLISVNNTPSTLFNSGTLNGAVNVFGSTVATSNWINGPTGIANLGSGSSSYSGNLANGGNVNLGAGGTLTILGNTQNAGRVTFAGAGTFTTVGSMANTGIINARNNLTSNVVTVGGNYSGGGQFWTDYSTNTATADRLNIGGSATGNTNVTMNLVGTRSFVPGGFLPVVTVAGAAPASAFTSSTLFPTTGFILDSFGQNPSNAHQFGVIQAVNPTAAGLGNLSYMAESASGLLDDPISPFVTNRTDAGGTRFSLWMRGSGGHSKQTISSSLTGGGMSYNSTTRLRTSQHAAQIGADVSFGGIGGGWKVNVGVMGGWYGASAPLAGGERIKVETPFVGGYAVVGNGAFELEGNIRKEWRHYTVAMPSLFGTVGTQRMRGDATAGSVRASYRIGGKTGFAATPFASFNYADTQIDPLVVDAFSVWTPGSDTTKIGQAGLRLSYRGGSEATATVEPFISAARMENWSRSDSSSFAFGAPVTTFSLQSNTWKNAMRYSAGILANAHGSRVSGFVVGNIDDDSRLRSFTINAGLRFNF